MTITQLRQHRNAHHEVGQNMNERLAAFEAALGVALEKGSELVGSFPAARYAAGVSPIVGQAAVSHLAVAVGKVTEAMDAAVAGHVVLDDLRRRFRLPEFAGGDKDPYPDPKQR